MEIMTSNYLLVGSILVISAILMSKIGPKVGIPSLMIFLIAGMIFGTDGLGIQFDSIKDAQFIGMVALSVILFTGGMDTQIKEIKPVIKQGIMLSTVGVALTTLITGSFVYLFRGPLELQEPCTFAFCLLLAATMSSTDSASVFSILRDQKMGLKHRAQPLLELESGSNDPMAYMLTIMLIQICSSPDASVGRLILNFVIQFTVGSLMGYLMAEGTKYLQKKINLKNATLYPIIMLCVVFLTFSLTELLRGNGYLAVYIAGIIVGNSKIPQKRECQKFLDGMTWLLQITMFITLGLLVNPHELLDIALIAIAVSVFLILIGRPVAVFLSLLPFKEPNSINARTLISWVGLRGATPIIFATYPIAANIPGASHIFNIVFFVTLTSLIVQGTTIPWISKRLEMTENLPDTKSSFGVELPEDADSTLSDMEVTAELLKNGNRIKDIRLSNSDALVVMIKRDKKHLVPKGNSELQVGDKLLLLAKNKDEEKKEEKKAKPEENLES